MKLTDLLDRVCAAKTTMGDVREDVAQYITELRVKRVPRPCRVMLWIGDMGVASWRAYTPFLKLAEDPRFEVQMSQMLRFPADLEWLDVAWFLRTIGSKIVRGDAAPMRQIAAAGKPMVFDLDDWIHGVPLYNPCHVGVAKENQPALLEEILGLVDVLTVSTPYLGKLYAPMAKRVEVLPNCLTPELWEPPAVSPFGAHDTVNIGWAGSNTHYDDVKLIEPALADLMRRRKDVCFFRYGAGGPDARRGPTGEWIASELLGKLPQERLFGMAWEPYTHHLRKLLAPLDIGLAPLVHDNDFNRAKSFVKWLEYSAMGIPTIATHVDPYAEAAGHVVLVRDNSLAGWSRALEWLVKDAESRRSIGAAARAHVMAHHTIDAHIGKWADLLLELARGRKAT
jgi:glycosyltransferase involved in cell wall biosynthesis